jgi:hypothetical protein
LHLAELEDRSVPSTLIPVGNRRDLVFDPGRDLLYVTTSAGTVQRYDVAGQVLLTPLAVGTSLNGADISPDGSALYVTDSQTANGGAQGVLHKVNLADGSVTNLLYDEDFMEGGSFDLAIANNGKGLFDGIFLGSGWVPVRQVDLATDALSTRPDWGGGVRLNTQIGRGADRGLFVFTESDISSGPVELYDARTDSVIATTDTNAFLDRALSAVNRDGTLIAMELNGTVTIYDRGLNVVKTLPNLAGGVVFDPVRDLLFVAHSNGTVYGFDTTTWLQRYALSIGESYSSTSAFGNGVMTISADGSRLFVSTPSGVRMIDVPPLAGSSHLAVSGFPMPTTAGAPGSFTVSAVDAQGNLLTNYTGTVGFVSSDPQAVLPAEYTFTAADQGVHTFTATLKTAGVRTLTAYDAGSTLASGSQGNVYVAPAAVSTVSVTGYPSPTAAGASHSFTVTLRDAFNNAATNYRGVVTFSSSDPQAALPFSYLFGASDAGTHTFNATLKTAGTQSITVRDSVYGVTGTQAGITVTPGAATALSVGGFPSPTTAGVPGTLTVTARDAYGNAASGYTGTVRFTSSDFQAALPTSYTFTAADQGVHTFTATLKTAGSKTLTATDTVSSAFTGTQTVTVTAAATARLGVSPTGGEPTAGTPFNVLVRALDAYGNLTTGYTRTVQFTSGDPQATLPADYTFTAADAGQHTFGVILRTVAAPPANGQTVTAIDTGSGISSGTAFVAVRPAAAAHYQLFAPAEVAANSPFAAAVEAFDPYGNQATGYLGTVAFTRSDPTGVLPANYTFTFNDRGYHAFNGGFTLSTLGDQTVTATDTANGTITASATVTVNPQVTGLHFTVSPDVSTVAAGSPFNLTVTALDSSEAVATGYTGTVHFTTSDPGSQVSLPADYTFTAADAGVHTFTGVHLVTAGARTVTAADPGIADGSSAGSGSVQVTPGTVTQFAVGGFPSPVTAGTAGDFTATAKDAYGNVATNYAGTVTVTSSDTRAVLPGAYTFTAADQGIHTFTAILKTAGTQSLTVAQSNNGLIRGVQSGITVTAAATAQLSVAPYPFVTAGVAFSVAVTATDAYGNATPGYTGTIHFTTGDPQGTLPADYTFTAADAGFHNFVSAAVLKTAGTQTVTATDTGVGSIAGTGSTQVSPGSIYSLYAYQTPQTFASVAGQVFSIAVEAHDAYNNIATGFRGLITWTSTDAQATLAPAYTFTAADNGAHLFANATTLRTAGWQSVVANYSSPTLNAQGVVSVQVSPAAVSRLQFSGATPTVTAGTPTSFTLTARDAYNNAVTGFTGSVHFTTTDPAGTVPPDYAFQGSDQGVHTFTNATTFFTAGARSVTAVGGGVSGSNNWTVQAAAANHVRVTGPAASTAGSAFAATVTALDPYDNVATAYRGTIHFTSTDARATLPADYTFVGADLGTHTFSGVTLVKAGSQTVTATDTAAITGDSSVAVSPAAASHFTVIAPRTATAGAPFDVTVTALDPFDNAATGYTGTAHFGSSDALATLPADAPLTGGVGTFTATLRTAGNQTLTATDSATGTITGTSGTIAVGATTATRFAVSAPTSATAGSAFGVTVTALDAFGNTATGYAGTVRFTSTDAQATLPADYTFTPADAGTHSFSATLKTAGTHSLTATDTAAGSITGSQSGITVTAAAAAYFTISAPASVSTGTPFAVTITARDAYGNVATGYRGTVHFASSDRRAVLPSNHTFTAGDGGSHTFTVTLKTKKSQTITVSDTVNGSITGTAVLNVR